MFNSRIKHGEIQLKMDFNIDFVVEGNLKLLVLKNIVKEIDLSFIKNSYSHKAREPAVDPITMFQILIYCYSKGVRTSREIEKFCKYDLRIIYLLEGTKAPNYSTISRFRNRLEPFVEKALFNYNMFLIIMIFLAYQVFTLMGQKLKQMPIDTHLYGKNQFLNLRKN